MKLTKIELKGFKSFGNKVVINFSEDITGIVGPNGCGKSNIVDAFRWVLGEQKSSILRSEKMEDIIFNGSKTRKAQQMAEVSISFTNTKNILSVEYSEITITRKYYRNAKSEYLLNGTPCQLKNITNLFLDTGIGPDSYAIIELAMVKDILKDKDNSRRLLIEEAAGISKFRVRKKQTLKKLDATDQDLERIKDILFENEKNLKELKRQAKQTEKFYTIKEQYKENSITLARISMQKINEKFNELQNQTEKENNIKIELNKQLAQKDAEIEKIKFENLDKEKSLSMHQKNLNEHVEKIRNIENEKNLSKEKLKHLNEKKHEFQNQIDQDNQNIEKAESEMKRFKVEKENEEKFLTEIDRKLISIKKENETQEKKTSDLQEKINNLSSLNSPLITKKEHEIDRVKEKLTQTNHKLLAKQSELNSTKSFIDNLKGFPEAIKFLKENVQWSKEAPLVSDIISTDEQYRMAIEYYLEPLLNYYIVEKPQYALQAVNLLHDAAKGRSHFFVLSFLKNFKPTPKTKFPNTVLATDIVKYDQKFHELVNYLLDGVYIVTGKQQDLPNNNKAIFITQNGKITKRRFSISGGSIGLFDGKRIDRAKNLDKLQKEIDLLALEIDDLKINLDKKHKELQILRQKENEIKNYIKELTTQNETLRNNTNILNQYKIDFNNQQNKITGIEQDMRYNQISINGYKDRLQKNAVETNNTNKEIIQLNENMDIIDNNLIIMYKDNENLEKEVKNADEKYFSVREQIHKLEDETKEINRNRENINNLILKLQEELNESKLELNSVKERLSVEFNINIDDLSTNGHQAKTPDSTLSSMPLEELKEKVEKLRQQCNNMSGYINPRAKDAYEEQNERINFRIEQRDDILKAKESLLETINEIDIKATESFLDAFQKIRENFIEVYGSLFSEEDSRDLILSDIDNPLDSDIEIIAKPKGKKPSTINQLSGGEQALTAIALLFAIYLLKPAPFCIFDEVDAPLDDVNTGKFNNIIKRFSNNSQFIIITHNKLTMANSDVIYGITMVEEGVSKVVPVDFREYA